MYHVFFSHSLIDGHVGWFHLMAIMNSIVINMVVKVSLWYVDLVWCGHMVVVFLIFGGIATLIPNVTIQDSIPASGSYELLFPHTFTSIFCHLFSW